MQLRRQEVLELRGIREQVLLSPDGPHHHYRGPAGLWAEIWAESIPGLALVALRDRIHREAGEPLGSVDWDMITRVVLGPSATEKPDPEGTWQCRYFEEYVPQAWPVNPTLSADDRRPGSVLEVPMAFDVFALRDQVLGE